MPSRMRSLSRLEPRASMAISSSTCSAPTTARRATMEIITYYRGIWLPVVPRRRARLSVETHGYRLTFIRMGQPQNKSILLGELASYDDCSAPCGCGLSSAGMGWVQSMLAGLLRVCVLLHTVSRSERVTLEDAMGSKSDQAKGLANQAAGKLKQGVSKVTGSKETQAKGAAQEVKGKAQQAMGKTKSAVKVTANKMADKANKKL
jgi:uncharacterized protein YjbJ (UPF0337 family)